MRTVLSLFVALLLLAPWAAGEKKQDTADHLLSQAAAVGDPAAAVNGPYRMEYKLILHTPKGPTEGSYSFAWISHNQTHATVSLAGFSATEVSDGSFLWIKRSPHNYEPQIITQFLADMRFAWDVKLAGDETISKIRQESDDNVRLQCLEIHRRNVMPSLSERSVCFGVSEGALVRLKEADHRTEFSDFERKGNAQIARKIRQFRGHELLFEAELISLVPQMPDAAVLGHPQGSRQFNLCNGTISPGRLIRHTNPVYPAIARAGHQTGAVEIYLVIDTDGAPKDIEIIHGVSKLLDDAALDAIRQWRYEPYKCGDVPIQVESDTVVNFSM